MREAKKELKWIKEIVDEVSKKYDGIWRQRNREIESKFLISLILQKTVNNSHYAK